MLKSIGVLYCPGQNGNLGKWLDGLVLDTSHNAKLSMDVRELLGTTTIRGLPLIKIISMVPRFMDVLFALLLHDLCISSNAQLEDTSLHVFVNSNHL